MVLSEFGKQLNPGTAQNQPPRHHAPSANLAGAALKVLKSDMKDPDSFELKSLIVHQSGAACYDYRAMNSFNAHIGGSAVFTPKGKFLTQEQDGEAFVTAWNKVCTPADGKDMTEAAKYWLRPN